MKPYSDDLRQRVIAALETAEETQEEIAARFSVSLSFVEKLWHRWRTTGSFAALPHAGGQKRRLEGCQELIRAAVVNQPDAALAELCETVAVKTNQPEVSRAIMCLELQGLELPGKKVAAR